MATPTPPEVAPWYLRNINQALGLDTVTGNVYIRTDSQITGNVTIPGNIEAHVTELGNVDLSGTTLPATVYQGTDPWLVNATLTGNSLPSGEPWQLQVAKGQVVGTTGLSISGYSSSIGTSFQPAWEDGSYVYFGAAAQVRLWSESASDTNVSVLITGLDSNYVVQTETLVLTNGITGVVSTKNFLRVNSISLTRIPQNVGRLHVGSSDKSITLAYIGTTSNTSTGRSQMTVYTVPAGYTFYLTQSNWYTNQTGSQTALYRSWTQTSTGLINTVLTFPVQQQYNSTKIVPRPYTEKTDIQWQVASSQGTSAIGGQIEGYLVAN